MPQSFRVAIGCVILLMMFASLGCEAVPSPVPTFTPPSATPTFISTPSQTPVPFPDPTATLIISPSVNTTPTRCRGFIWAYGTVSPEFISQVQDAMRIAGLEGSVKASTFGETNLCGTNYGARNVDYVFTVQVGSLETSEDIASMAAVVQEIAQRLVDKSPAPYLGRVQLIFKSGELQCTWKFEDEPWEFFSVTAANGKGCRLPANERTRPFAAALAALSIDLACESFTMTADMLSVSSECQRSEGANHYTVRVTFNLDGGGSEATCFHGWFAQEKNLSGPEPLTVIEDGKMVYEQKRSFEWTTNSFVTFIYERLRGEQQATFPPDTREKVYLHALQEGLIPGTGTNCR